MSTIKEIEKHLTHAIQPRPSLRELELISEMTAKIEKDEGLALERAAFSAITSFYDGKIKKERKYPKYTASKKTYPFQVVESNALIRGRYQYTLNEEKVALYALLAIYRKSDDFEEYSFNIADFKKLLGTDQSHVYTEMVKITHGLSNKGISILEPDGSLLQCNWFSHAYYRPNKAIVDFTFDPLLKKHLLKLKTEFTSLNIKGLLECRSRHTVHLYKLLRSFLGMGGARIQLEDLKDRLGVEGKYERYCDFKSQVLTVATKEINKRTDLRVAYSEIRKRKTVIGFNFKMQKKLKRIR